MADTSTAEMLSTAHEDFVALARGLSDEQWSARSWCPNWTVQNVVEHVAFHIHRESIVDLVGSTPKRTEAMLTRQDATTRAGLLAFLATPVPPKAVTPINTYEVVIHAQDVRGSLGMSSTVPQDTLRATLDSCAGRAGNIFVVGRKTRIGRGVHLRATDLDWEHGSGPDVRGPALALLMAIAGRSPAFADLVGAGVARMASRVDTPIAIGTP
jgi:uncharacterized protein (TIGR03083 family)